MDHPFHIAEPRSVATVTVRAFACEPWPADLLARLAEIETAPQPMPGRGYVRTRGLTWYGDAFAGEFTTP